MAKTMSQPVDRDDVCDYVISRLTAAGAPLNVLKLQKLMYYIQAWHLAFSDSPLFWGRFQAWVHGPVNRQLYDRFAISKSLYSEIRAHDIRPGFVEGRIPSEARAHIESVLEVYAGYSGTQLEEMTHNEEPWIEAREGYASSDRCEREIDERSMAKYYRSRIEESDGGE